MVLLCTMMEYALDQDDDFDDADGPFELRVCCVCNEIIPDGDHGVVTAHGVCCSTHMEPDHEYDRDHERWDSPRLYHRLG